VNVLGLWEVATFGALVAVLFLFTLAISLILAMAWDYFRH
jgi:hypothetical protein